MNQQISSGDSHAVVIYEDGRYGSGPYKIAPATLIVNVGDSILFRNLTKVDVQIAFVGDTPLTEREMNVKSESSDTRQVGSVSDGPYAYDALCGKGGELAEGSRPMIIVYDRK